MLLREILPALTMVRVQYYLHLNPQSKNTIDADIVSELDVDDEAVSVDRVLARMDDAKKRVNSAAADRQEKSYQTWKEIQVKR